MTTHSQNDQAGGWVRLYRSSLSDPVFESESLWRLWTWCMMKASHAQTVVPLKIGRGVKLVDIEIGQFIFGRKAASIELGIAPETARDRMKKLAVFGLIKIKSRHHYSIITILNIESLLGTMPEARQATAEPTASGPDQDRPTTRQASRPQTRHKQEDEVHLRSTVDSSGRTVGQREGEPAAVADDQVEQADRGDQVERVGRAVDRRPDERTEAHPDELDDQGEQGDRDEQVEQSDGGRLPLALSKAEEALLSDAEEIAFELARFLPMKRANDRDKNLVAKVCVLVVKGLIRRGDAIDCASGVKFMYTKKLHEGKPMHKPFAYFHASLKEHKRIERFNMLLARTQLTDTFVDMVLMDSVPESV